MSEQGKRARLDAITADLSNKYLIMDRETFGAMKGDLIWARTELEHAWASHEALVSALELFERQWNACGPNSDFGRYFSNVRDAARAALQAAKE